MKKQKKEVRRQQSGEAFRETDEIVCAKFNARYPVGTAFWVLNEFGQGTHTITTTSDAWVSADGIFVRDDVGVAWAISRLRLDDVDTDTPRRPNYAATILQDAIDAIANRAAQRDQPSGERSMATAVETFFALTGIGLSEREGWVFMALLKLAHAQQGGLNPDDYIDSSAYAALAGEAAIRGTMVYPSGEDMPDGVKREIARDTVRVANTHTQRAIDNDLAAHDDG